MNHPSGSPPCQVPSGTLRERDGNRQDGKWTHQDSKTQRKPISKELDQVATQVVDAAFQVHSTLGPGLLESVYEVCLEHELIKRGFSVEKQVPLPVLCNHSSA
ncbi:GxxExxY protein [Pelatocladus sp. BLCC-F211]|uniref:GxxExxY protein n=1 Tax=Pelatocladus sp. BLCC-F211 TaxID=3342752 RepID=UPI0035BAC7C7